MSHEDTKIADRLAELLTRLVQGRTLYPDDLAQEFGVTRKTIDRDLGKRLITVTAKHREHGKVVYRLENMALSVLSSEDIKRFALLSGIAPLYPQLTPDFLKELLQQTSQNNLLVKGYEYEDWSRYRDTFLQLHEVIAKHRRIQFHYKDKMYDQVEPYKLVSLRALWYLAAVHDGKLKSFHLSKISFLTVLPDVFTPNAIVEEQTVTESTLWYGENKKEIVLRVDKQVADHFTRRSILPHQKVLNTLEDGSLIVASYVVSDMQILPLVRYWLPHLRIINPDGYQDKLNQQLRDYLAVTGS